MEEDIYIPENFTGGAFHGDTVEVSILPGKNGRRVEGTISKILVRGITELVGTYKASKHFGFVHPDLAKIPEDIFIAPENTIPCAEGKKRRSGDAPAEEGDKVVVHILRYGDPAQGLQPEGEIREIIGNISEPGVDILSVIKANGLPLDFPAGVKSAATRTPDTLRDKDLEGRADLRDLTMITIDGEDSKDLDDAVSLRVEHGKYYLGVHIADVSYYVKEGGSLDREALKRGTSVYLADRVIPMLPRRLSNGICSLNQGEDRLALSCLMTINAKGSVLEHEIVESVIHVDERMTYTGVAAILEDQDEKLTRRYADVVPMLQEMQKLAAILKERRHERGSIDFDLPEAKILLDSDGNPTDIQMHERNTATELIEDFMLIANETVARHFHELNLPFLYRVHEKPDFEKLSTLKDYLKTLGVFFNTGKNAESIRPMDIQNLLAKVEGDSAEGAITRMTLRSMMQARYDSECIGHFGLALTDYCHFTSPIRRYPDLQIHRIIHEYLHGKLTKERIAHYKEILDGVAQKTSALERRATDAERETDKLKKAQYMEQHIGDTFEGVISGVTGFGFFVELPNTCEGMVRAVALEDDYYIYEEDQMRLVGERTGVVYALGQKVRVEVAAADRLTKNIDFRVADDNEALIDKSHVHRGGRGKHGKGHRPEVNKARKQATSGGRHGRKKHAEESAKRTPKVEVSMTGEAMVKGEKKRKGKNYGPRRRKKAHRK